MSTILDFWNNPKKEKKAQCLFETREEKSSEKKCKMALNFQEIIDKAFDYNEALKRQELKQEDVEKLREKIKDSKFVPKSIVDKQVKNSTIWIKFWRPKKVSPIF